MLRITALYAIFSGLLTAYLGEILHIQARIGKIRLVCGLVFATGLALSQRLPLLRYHRKTLNVHFQKAPQVLCSPPFQELCCEVVLWVLLGSVLGILTGGPCWTTWKTTVQLFCSSLMIGPVIGAFNLRHMLRQLYLASEEIKRSMEWPIKRMGKVGAKVAYHGRRWYVHVASAFLLASHHRAVFR